MKTSFPPEENHFPRPPLAGSPLATRNSSLLTDSLVKPRIRRQTAGQRAPAKSLARNMLTNSIRALRAHKPKRKIQNMTSLHDSAPMLLALPPTCSGSSAHIPEQANTNQNKPEQTKTDRKNSNSVNNEGPITFHPSRFTIHVPAAPKLRAKAGQAQSTPIKAKKMKPTQTSESDEGGSPYCHSSRFTHYVLRPLLAGVNCSHNELPPASSAKAKRQGSPWP